MKNTKINFIGCGKLGKTIAKLIKIKGLGEISGIVNSTKQSAIDSTIFIGAGIPCSTLDDLPPADITFITTRDDIIEEIALKLHNTGKIKAGSIILHCSGSLTSDVLSATKNSNASVSSIHPIKSFANPEQAVNTFDGTYCAVEGDQSAMTIAINLFEKLGGIIVPIKKEKKKIYHAGGVIANNYLVTLHHHATACYMNTGIEEATAKKIVRMLMNDALNNLQTLNHTKALTGPIQRGDIKTISNHIEALSAENTLQYTKDLYKSIGEKTVELTTHDDDIKRALAKTLSQNTSNQEIRSKL